MALIPHFSLHFPLTPQRCRIGVQFNPSLNLGSPPFIFRTPAIKLKKFYALTSKRIQVFVRISEEAGIIPVHDINWSVFIFRKEGV